MMQTDITSWSAAIALSLLIHGMLFVQNGASPGVEYSNLPQLPVVTRLNFSQLEPVPVPDAPPPLENKPDRPQQKVKPAAVKKTPVVEQAVPDTVREVVKRQESAPQARGQQHAQSNDGLLKLKRQQYFHKLLGHIESYKYYPRAARKRAIEGSVGISFELNADGSYRQLRLDGRHAILVKATRHALESALPLPSPPDDIELSAPMQFSMAYSLAR